MNRALVTFDAGALCHATVARLDADGLVKVVEGEGEGMEKPVVRLRDPFADGMMGKVAIDADRGCVMTRVLPRVVIVLHDVAVHARSGVAAQITGTVSVTESEETKSARQTQRSREDEIHAARDGEGANSTFWLPGFHGDEWFVAAQLRVGDMETIRGDRFKLRPIVDVE